MLSFLSGFAQSWDKYDLVWIAAIIVCWIYGYRMRASGNGELREFLRENAVKLLVLIVFFFLVIFGHHSAEHSAEGKFADWCMAKAGEALACFFGLIQGKQPGMPPPVQPTMPGSETTVTQTTSARTEVKPIADPKTMPPAAG